MRLNELTNDVLSEGVAGAQKCWPGHRKVGTQPGTGKNKGKRVNDCEKIKEQGVAEGLSEMDNRTSSGDRREKRNNSPEEKAKQDKEQQKRLTATSPEMRKKLRLPEPKQGVAEAAKWRNHPDAHDLDTDGSYIPKGGIKSDNLAIRQGASKTQSEKDPKSMAGMFGAKYAKKHGVPTKQLMKNIPLGEEQGVAEGTGSSIERILAAHPEAVENFKQGGDLDYDLESDLWEYYYNNGEIRNYDADASEFISQRLADELGLSEGLDANQKRVGQLGPTEQVKNNNIGKLVGANENFINTVDQAVVSEEDEMAESILSAIKKVGKKVIDTVAPGDEELLKQLDKDVHGGKVPNRYNSDSESAKKYPADSWKAKVDESSDELARILTIMNHRR